MSFTKKIITAIFLMISLFASPAFAAKEDHNAGVRKAGEETIAKVEEALKLAESKGDKQEILKLFGDIRQSQKEFRYEQTERLRQKAGDKLRIAREEVEAGKDGIEAIKATLAIYKEMWTIYLAAH